MPADNKTPTKNKNKKQKAKSMFTEKAPNGYQTLGDEDRDDSFDSISKT